MSNDPKAPTKDSGRFEKETVSDIEELLASHGVNIEAAKAGLKELAKSFSVPGAKVKPKDTSIPDAALSRWADEHFHGVSNLLWVELGRRWLG